MKRLKYPTKTILMALSIVAILLSISAQNSYAALGGGGSTEINVREINYTFSIKHVDTAGQEIDPSLNYSNQGKTESVKAPFIFHGTVTTISEYQFQGYYYKNETGTNSEGSLNQLLTDGQPHIATILSADHDDDIGTYTVYMVYKATPKKQLYTIQYDANGGAGIAPVQTDQEEGAIFAAAQNTFAPPASKQFVEWNTQADGTGTSYKEGVDVTMPASALTLYAIWEDAPAKTTTENPSKDQSGNPTKGNPTDASTNVPDNKDTTKYNTSTPQTGDNSNMMLWVFVMVIALGTVAVTLYRKKKS